MSNTCVLYKRKEFYDIGGRNKISKICDYCNSIETASNKFKKCECCKQNSYCSQECQIADWEKVHKIKCNSLPVFNNSKQKILSRIFKATILYNKTNKTYPCFFSDKDEIWHVENYDNNYFFLTKSSKPEILTMYKRYNINPDMDHWRVFYGDCIGTKICIDR